MKKILVSGYIGFNNFGDEAIFYALSNHLKSLGCFVSVLCSNKKEVKKRYQVKAYNYKKPLQILKGIIRSDVLISGGGSLLQNKTSNFSLFYYLFIIILAKLFFKKVIIFAQGIEPVKGRFETELTKFVLKICDFVSVRDFNSLNLLKSWKISAQLVSDPVYSLVQNFEINEDKKGLIVQLRKFEGIDEEFLNNLAQAIAQNYKEDNISVLSLQDEYDKEICENFIKILEKHDIKAELKTNETIEKTIEIINSSKYVISTRLHGLITANAFKSKAFALIYDEKVKTLSDELNIENIEIKDYKAQNLTKKLDDFFNNNQNEPHCPKVNYREFNWSCIDTHLL